jgi:hypothetical protein
MSSFIAMSLITIIVRIYYLAASKTNFYKIMYLYMCINILNNRNLGFGNVKTTQKKKLAKKY